MTDFKIPASSKAVPVFRAGLCVHPARAAGHAAVVPAPLYGPV